MLAVKLIIALEMVIIFFCNSDSDKWESNINIPQTTVIVIVIYSPSN